MWFVYFLLAVLIIGLAVLFFLMVKGFRNPVVRHEIPKNLPFKIQEVWITTRKNKKLYAWWIPVDEAAPTIIFVHGWGRNSQRMMTYLKKFCCKGFNMLAFDARSHGNSDADGYTNLVKFAEDTLSVIDYLEKRSKTGNKDFYLVGLSIGGAASIYAAAHDPRVKKVITVGAFARPAVVMRKQFADRHIPYFPLVWLLFKYVKVFQHLDLETIAPVKHIINAKARFLLVHGEQDQTVPVDQALRLKKAAGDKAELWTIPNRGHSDCHLEKGFWEKAIGFFES